MATNPVDRIAELLDDEAVERRIAAAIVLGALETKRPKAVRALVASLADDVPLLQRHALNALAKIAPAEALEPTLALLGARDASLRDAAIELVVAAGPKVVSTLEARLAEGSPEERRAIEQALARMGGKDALSALLAGLADATEQQATAAAVTMRQQAKSADGRLKRSYLAQLEKAIASQLKRSDASVPVLKASVKMLGYLEHEQALPTLQKLAASAKVAASVRQEALIALRFTLGGKRPDAKLVKALVAAAEDDDRALAQTALMTIAGLDLGGKTATKLMPLLHHHDVERARFVIDMLGSSGDADAAAPLVELVADGEIRRAKLAADALKRREDCTAPLVDALVACRDRERAALLSQALLKGAAKPPTKAQHKRLLAAAVTRLREGDPAWQATLDVARHGDADATVAALRELFGKLKRKQPPELATRVLRIICRSEQATHDDHYQLVARLLSEGDPQQNRAGEALALLTRLAMEGYDVVASLRRDRSLDLTTLYDAGFHLAERGHPAGGDLLQHVADKGGRKKIAKMAKNKLALLGREG